MHAPEQESCPRRRMRRTVAIRESVVPAVIGHPPDHRALDGQRAGDREIDLESAVCLEGPVSEVSVKTHGDSAARDDVERKRECDVEPVDTPTPRHRDRTEQSQERNDYHYVEQGLFAPHLRPGESWLAAGCGCRLLAGLSLLQALD